VLRVLWRTVYPVTPFTVARVGAPIITDSVKFEGETE